MATQNEFYTFLIDSSATQSKKTFQNKFAPLALRAVFCKPIVA
jgi:hypothetical protein